jgi:cytoskeleton-associated protein 5
MLPESFEYNKTLSFLVLQTFQLKKLAHHVQQNTLNRLIMELLLWLLDERVPLMDDGSQLLKALNVLMLKILVSVFLYI